jgi:hypothetical protein
MKEQEMGSLHKSVSTQRKNTPTHLQKNIFDHNPFRCIREQTTVYLPHVSFKMKTPRR